MAGRVHLHYGARQPELLVFRDLAERCAARFPNFQVNTMPNAARGDGVVPGRIDLVSACRSLPRPAERGLLSLRASGHDRRLRRPAEGRIRRCRGQHQNRSVAIAAGAIHCVRFGKNFVVRRKTRRWCLPASFLVQAILFWPSLSGQKVLLPLDLLKLPGDLIPMARGEKPAFHNWVRSDIVRDRRTRAPLRRGRDSCRPLADVEDVSLRRRSGTSRPGCRRFGCWRFRRLPRRFTPGCNC